MSESIWPTGDKTQSLLAAARNGDDDAVNRLLEKHRDSVHRFVELRLDKQVRRRVDVSDVVQDVLVDASARLQKYLENPAMAFHLWIRQITSDRIIDAYRRHRGSAKRSLDREQPMAAPAGVDQSTMDLAAQLCDPERTPASAANHREIAGHVEDAIEELGQQDRDIILMRHFEHLSNAEVATVLEVSPPAASMRYLRAVRRLRELLDSRAGEDSTEGRASS